MILNLIKLADSLDSMGQEPAADNVDLIIRRIAGIGGDGFIQELVQELVTDTLSRGSGIFEMKDTITSLMNRHTDPKSLLPKSYEGMGDSDSEMVANYFVDMVTDVMTGRDADSEGTELDRTQMFDREPHGRGLSLNERLTSGGPMDEPTRLDVTGPKASPDEAGSFEMPEDLEPTEIVKVPDLEDTRLDYRGSGPGISPPALLRDAT
jgi:hypothetical protein